MSLVDDFVQVMNASDAVAACERAVAKHFPEVDRRCQVNLVDVVKSRGIELRESDSYPFEGMIDRAGIKTVIHLRKTQNPFRARFTLAHEIGHWVVEQELGSKETPLFRGPAVGVQSAKDEEYLANLLAAELLLPTAEVRARFDRSRVVGSIKDIGRTYGIGRVATIRRLADVLDVAVAILEIVPFKFKDLSTPAEIDDAVFVTPRLGTLYARRDTRFLSTYSYDSLVSGRQCFIEVDTPKGRLTEEFEVDARVRPVAHALLVALFPNGWPKIETGGGAK